MLVLLGGVLSGCDSCGGRIQAADAMPDGPCCVYATKTKGTVCCPADLKTECPKDTCTSQDCVCGPELRLRCTNPIVQCADASDQ